MDFTPNGKPRIPVDLTSSSGKEFAVKLIREADVLIECLRPGNMEKYGLGPEEMLKVNPRLIYAHFVGHGRNGPYALRSGHDGNFAALSGVLPLLGGGQNDNVSASVYYPSYIMSFATASPLCAFGIVAAIVSRDRVGQGQVVELSTTEAMAYGATAMFISKNSLRFWPGGDQRSFSGDIYETLDEKFMSVCFHEDRFFPVFRKALSLDTDPEFHLKADNSLLVRKVRKTFKTKTRDEWTEIFRKVDCCVEPVLDIDEAPEDEHNKFRKTFSRRGDTVLPNPSPRLSKTPAITSSLGFDEDFEVHAKRVLREFKLDENQFIIEGKNEIVRLKACQQE